MMYKQWCALGEYLVTIILNFVLRPLVDTIVECE